MRTDSKTLAFELRIAADEAISVPAAMREAAKRIEELEAIMTALTRWAKAKRGLDQAIDSRDPDECDYWHDEIAAAYKELIETYRAAKDTDDANNA